MSEGGSKVGGHGSMAGVEGVEATSVLGLYCPTLTCGVCAWCTHLNEDNAAWVLTALEGLCRNTTRVHATNPQHAHTTPQVTRMHLKRVSASPPLPLTQPCHVFHHQHKHRT